MCRHLAYLGPPVSLAALLLDRPHALLRQSWAPADMRGGGTVNADGFGAGWYVPGRPEPVRYRRATPIWSDPGFADLATATETSAALAAVRAATTGMPVTETANAPFVADGWLFSHNGVVKGWPSTVADIAARLPVTDLLTLDAPTDSALLWALLRARLRAGDDPGTALAELVVEVGRAAPDSRLNLLLTDGATIWATAWYHALSVRADGESVVVASEPWDAWDNDPAWQAVPDRHLIIAAPSGVTTQALADTLVQPASPTPSS